MPDWIYPIWIKHLLTKEEDHSSVQKCMNAIADVLERESSFQGFHEQYQFRDIPQGDNFFGPVDYANKLLDRMYNYADQHRIWIE